MFKLVGESAYFIVSEDAERKLVRVVRTGNPYPNLDELRATNVERMNVIERYRGKHYMLLLDARLSPMRNDPEFEQAAGEARAAMFQVFDKVAVLVKTAVGALQMSRLQKAQNTTEERSRVFENDEDGAIQFLTPP